MSGDSGEINLPFDLSIGYQIRLTHRLMQKLLQLKIEQFGVTLGMWYFLRVLWDQDGLTQKYLSDMTNVTENTTVSIINNMMQHGLVERTRDKVDRRKLSVTLTQRGKALEAELMQYAIDINRIAVAGIDPAEVATCVDVLSRMSANLAAEFDSIPNTPAED